MKMAKLKFMYNTIVLILLLISSPNLSASNQCRQLFEPGTGFFDKGLGVSYTSDGRAHVHLKLSREDRNPQAGLFRRWAAKSLNALLRPVSDYFQLHKLDQVVTDLEADERPISYKHKLAEAFRLKLNFDLERARAAIPAEGPMIMIGPHVRAGIDGIVMASLATLFRKQDDVLIVLTKGLTELKGIHENAVLIDDSGTPEGRRYNENQKIRIQNHLQKGGAIVMFPSGENATKHSLDITYPYDMSWKPGLFDFSRSAPDTVIVPVFIEGQLSDSFQAAKLKNKILGQLHLPSEMALQVGNQVGLMIGEPLAARDILNLAEHYARQYSETAQEDLTPTANDLKRASPNDHEKIRWRNSFLAYIRNEMYGLMNANQNRTSLSSSEWIHKVNLGSEE